MTVPFPIGCCALSPRSWSRPLVIWGMDDQALLPVQLDGIGEVGDDVEVVPARGGRPFRAMGSAEQVAAALGPSSPAMSPATGAPMIAPDPVPLRRPARRRAGALPAGDGGHAARPLIHEFHDHRLGATIEDVDLCRGRAELLRRPRQRGRCAPPKSTSSSRPSLRTGWSLERLDRPMRAILRAGAYELLARADVPVASVITEYVDVAHAFYDKREKRLRQRPARRHRQGGASSARGATSLGERPRSSGSPDCDPPRRARARRRCRPARRPGHDPRQIAEGVHFCPRIPPPASAGSWSP